MNHDDYHAIEAAFVAGFRQAPDKTGFLRLARVPAELSPEGELGLKLIEVKLDESAVVGSASPGFASRELVYHPLPGVEAGILASLVALGLLVAGVARLPLGMGLGLVAVTALFHGHAHGSELPLADSPLSYGVGFTLASLVLMGAGMALGLGTRHSGVREKLLRAGGVAMAATGLALLAA